MPLDRPLDSRVINRIATILLPDPEDEGIVRIDEASARTNLEAAGVDPSRLASLKGNEILRRGLQIANEDPSVIERYLQNTTHLLNGLEYPTDHDYLVGEIRAALQADAYDLAFNGNAATIVPYVQTSASNESHSAALPRQKTIEIDRVIRWFDRLAHAQRVLLDRRRPEKDRPHAKYPIQDEYDLQDLFLAFLTLEYPLAHKEDPTFMAAGLSGRVDIVVPELELYIELKYHDKNRSWNDTRQSLSDKVLFYPDGLRCTTLILAIFDSDFTLPKAAIEADFVKTLKMPAADVTIRAVVCQ